MKLETSSLYSKLLFSLALLIITTLKSVVAEGDEVTGESTNTTASTISRIPTTFPTTPHAVPSEQLTQASRAPSPDSDLERMDVLLTGTIIPGGTVTSDANEISAYLGPQLTALCKVKEGRVSNIVLHQPGNNITGLTALTFTLSPGSNPNNDEAALNIISLFQTNNKVKLILYAEGPEFPLSLPVYTRTDNGPCPVGNCENSGQCNEALTGQQYCEYPNGCYACTVTTRATTKASEPSSKVSSSSSSSSSKLGLLGLLAIPVVIAAAIVAGAVYFHKRRQQREQKIEIFPAAEDTGRGQVYQNTVGKSYATVYNGSIFNGATEEESDEKKSTMRL